MPISPKTPPKRTAFRLKVWLTWFVLLVLLVSGGLGLGLDFDLIGRKLPFLIGLHLSPDGFLEGAALTVFVTASSMVFALALGVLAALGRLSKNPFAFAVATFYGSLFRGTPLIVQVLIIYLGLPEVGIVLTGLKAGIIALSLNYGAYLSEMIRSGVISVPQGQREAAMALGLSRWQITWKVVFPQATRVIIPPAGTQFVSMLKDSSLVAQLGLFELTYLMQSYGRAAARYLDMLVTGAIIYWLLSLVFEAVQARLERRFGRGFEPRGR